MSQLAREVMISRPAVHAPETPENAGLVTSKMELSEDGKAMNYYEIIPFVLQLSPESIVEAVKTLSIKRPDEQASNNGKGDKK